MMLVWPAEWRPTQTSVHDCQHTSGTKTRAPATRHPHVHMQRCENNRHMYVYDTQRKHTRKPHPPVGPELWSPQFPLHSLSSVIMGYQQVKAERRCRCWLSRHIQPFWVWPFTQGIKQEQSEGDINCGWMKTWSPQPFLSYVLDWTRRKLLPWATEKLSRQEILIQLQQCWTLKVKCAWTTERLYVKQNFTKQLEQVNINKK